MELRDLSEVDYHPIQEKIVHVLKTKTQNYESDLYFRVLSVFYMCQVSTAMRAEVVTPHRGKLPTNLFALNLGESGMGKGYSMNVIERSLLKGFRETFLEYTFKDQAELSIADSARKASIRNGSDEEEERQKLEKVLNDCGELLFSYDSGTGPAYKQQRTKCQIAKVGSLTMICDEIGTNLLSNAELFATNLEAYDIGLIKAKLIKNSSENVRSKDRNDPVPSNMLCFGTPTKLFNGGMEEREMWALLETGYARRFMFGYGMKTATNQLTAEELFDVLTSGSVDKDMDKLSSMFESMADSINYGREIPMSRAVTLINIQYQLECEAKAEKLSNYEGIRKAELQHRYFKALKIAGTYAFMDGSPEVTAEQMYAAIKLVQDSGECFNAILTRDRAYARLAKYICAVKKEVTHADLSEDLPFYTGSKSARDDMMHLATAWGHRNNYLLKKSFVDGIEFFKGETLEETNVDELTLSYSNHEAYNFNPAVVKWEKLHNLTQMKGMHWCTHSFVDNHRKGDNVITGFNLVVIDVDKGVKLDLAKYLLKDYKCLFYTTKRHQTEGHGDRFRIVIPMKYKLNLTEKDFKEFMENIYSWLPFDSDEETDQRCRKWMSNSGEHHYNDGELLDPVMFIPKTNKNAERKKQMEDLSNMDKVEAWFAQQMTDGSRNNTMAKFAFMLLDHGLDPEDVEDAVIVFNEKLSNGLSLAELKATVLKSMWNKAKENP